MKSLIFVDFGHLGPKYPEMPEMPNSQAFLEFHLNEGKVSPSQTFLFEVILYLYVARFEGLSHTFYLDLFRLQTNLIPLEGPQPQVKPNPTYT